MSWTARSLVGSDALARLGAALDELHTTTGTPLTAQRRWLEIWMRCFDNYEPWVIGIETRGGRLDAAALLGRRRRAGVIDVVALGHGQSDQLRLPARDPEAARALSTALVAELKALPRPWRLLLTQLPVDDPAAKAFARSYPHARLRPGQASPTARFGDDRSPRAYLSRSHLQEVRRQHNRLRREGVLPEFEVLRDRSTVAAALPEMVEVYRRRDTALCQKSKVDDPHAGLFYRTVILELAGRGQVEIVALRFNRQLAAYSLCFLDAGVRRLWSCRFDPAFRRYGAGRLANHQAICEALADPGCSEFDLMMGEELYKRGLSTDVVPAVELVAWSSAPFLFLDESKRRFGATLRAARDHDDRLQRLWTVTRTLRFNMRGRSEFRARSVGRTESRGRSG